MGEILWNTIWPVVLYDSITTVVGLVWNHEQVLAIQTVAAFVAAVILGIQFIRYKRMRRIWTGEAESVGDRWALQGIQSIVLGITSCLFLNHLIELSGLKQVFPGYQEVSGELFAPSLGLQILAMGILVPVVEELIFRGFIYGVLRKQCSFVMSAVVSAVLFGLYHGSVVQGLYAGVMAFVLAWSYEYSGWFLVPVTVHGISNLTAVLAEMYHLYDKNWSELPFVLWTVVCGGVTVWLLWGMRKANLKEDI